MHKHYVWQMSKNLNVRLTDEEWDKLEGYCLDTGRSKTALIKLVIQKLGTQELEKVLEKSRYSRRSD
jgi:predicted DNA-binding protein